MKTKPAKKQGPVGRARLDELGEDWLIEQITGTVSMTEIARIAAVNISTLLSWIELDDNRSARAREARAATALLWDERAEEEIRNASDPFELAKAKEIAHHYRWKAAKIAPKTYGDKQQVDMAVKASISIVSDFPDE